MTMLNNQMVIKKQKTQVLSGTFRGHKPPPTNWLGTAPLEAPGCFKGERLFFHFSKTTSTMEQFAHDSEIQWIIAAQLCSAPNPLPDVLPQFRGVGH